MDNERVGAKSGKVTLKDVAERLGVSIVAVSKALNDKDGISVALKERAKKTALEMGYEDAVLKSKLADYPRTVLVLLSERALNPVNMTQAFYLGFFQQISSMLAQKGFYTQLHVLSIDDEHGCIKPPLCSDKNITGLIFLGELDKRYMYFAADWKLPKILVDFYDKEIDISAVVTDNINCSYDITKLLLAKGHKQLGFIGTINATSSIQDRYMGYYKAMMEAGLEVKKEWVIDDRDENGTYIDIVLPKELPTAFVCNSDRAAYGTIEKLKSRGVNVPGDVSVVGFDNDIFSMVSRPTLTTVEVETVKMSAQAVEFLLAQIENNVIRTSKITVSGRLVQRDSVKEQGE